MVSGTAMNQYKRIAKHEVLMKSETFKQIVELFELYKIQCNKPRAQLQRVSERPSFITFGWWFDDFTEPKWQVPYSKRKTERSRHYLVPRLTLMKKI